MTDIILTRDEVAEIKSANQLSNGAQPLSGNKIESLISTIDHLYAQRDALMRVKEALVSIADQTFDEQDDNSQEVACRSRNAYIIAERKNFK